MELHVMNILEGLVTSRNTFFQPSTLRSFTFDSRDSIATRFILNETAILEVANRVYSTHMNTRSVAAALLSLSIPALNNANRGSFMEPVTVAPSLHQINSSLEDSQNTTSSCAICQEAISSGACRIRQCGHVYHRPCIVSWFSMSVRCPVCRHDIREENQANQTSVASEQMSSQQEDQSEEPNTSE